MYQMFLISFQEMPKIIGQKKCEKCTLSTFFHTWEIWWPIRETGRFFSVSGRLPDNLGDLVLNWCKTQNRASSTLFNVSYIIIIITFFSLLSGMCMCLSMITSPTTDKPLLITGYENGQLVLWDIMAAKVLTRSPAHSESGFSCWFVTNNLTLHWMLFHLYLIFVLLLVISVLCMDVDKEKLQIVSGSADNKLCVSSITPEVCLYQEPYLVM